MPDPDGLVLSPTVGRRWLAQEIRRLREKSGLKQSDVARRLRCNATKIGHLESGRNVPSGPDLEVMLPMLGVPDERIPWYLELHDHARTKGWWDGNQAIPDWFSLYVGLEWGASELHCWDLGYVPGLLQTRDYAEAVLRSGNARSDNAVNDQIELRVGRQQALSREEHPLLLHAIIDESVLHRVVGDEEVMRGQLRHLLKLAKHPKVTLQVMPLTAGAHRGQNGSFSWLGFPRPDDLGVVYVENLKGGLYLEEEAEIMVFTEEFERLSRTALTTRRSVALLRELTKERSG